MHRRQFLRAIAASTLAAAAYGCASTPRTEGSAPRGGSGQRVLVVGAGMAGLAAARTLANSGHQVTVVEARTRAGGRIWTDRTWPGTALDLGASWIHGVTGNPIAALAQQFGVATLPTDYDDNVLYRDSGQAVSSSSERTFERRYATLMDRVSAIRTQRANAGEPDIALSAAIAQVLAADSSLAADPQALNYLINVSIEHEYAADVAELSLFHWDEGDEFDGEDVLFPGGYDQLVTRLAAGLTIHTGQPVERIQYDASGVTVQTAGRSYSADCAVVTLPLGVLQHALQQGDLVFDPPLPAAKQAAIGRLGMGLLDKCYLRFPDAFWDQQDGAFHLLNVISAQKGRWEESLNIFQYTQAPILLCFNAATYARTLESQSDDAVVAAALQPLRAIYGDDIPTPDALITRWAEDPYARGSYSYLPVGAAPEDRDTLAAPVGGRLFFAGEATSRQYPATVHGAWLSGLRAAAEVANAVTPNPTPDPMLTPKAYLPRVQR